MSTSSSVAIALNVIKQHAGVIRSQEPLTVESADECWSYAVSTKLKLSANPPQLRALPLKVVAKVVVESGVLGCLLVADDWTTLVGTPAPPCGPGVNLFELAWEQDDVARLVFRNQSPRGPCVFIVEQVSVSALPEGVKQNSTQLDEILEVEGRYLNLAKLRAAVGRHESVRAVPEASAAAHRT
jgi:hypothetical protein